MTKKLLLALAGVGCMLSVVSAQTGPSAAPPSKSPTTAPDIQKARQARNSGSALNAQIFYQVLIGELSANAGAPAPAVSFILDAARKTNDPQLYQRATELALQSRSGESALEAARAWNKAYPGSLEASRFTLQILLALNRVAESAQPLKSLIDLTEALERPKTLALVPRLYARASDKKLAAKVVEQTLAPYFTAPATAANAWAMAAELRLAAGDALGALDAARQGQAADGQSEAPVLVAVELMDMKLTQAEGLISHYLTNASQIRPEVRMAYARSLLNARRFPEALVQLQTMTREKPEFAQGWLAFGSLQLQDGQAVLAEASLKRYIGLAEAQTASAERTRGLTQAFLTLAEIAEKRKDFKAAESWLLKIESPQALMQTQARRAALLARQGKITDAVELIRKTPELNEGDARSKLLAEVALLKEFRQYKSAHELMTRAVAASPADVDLIYEQSITAEKLGLLPEMERLLRLAISIKPDYHAAYNALGYSLADRNVRLPEAKQLIQKALQFAPGDPFIQDSLGWVEFRLGNRSEALSILTAAYQARPDAEIAAHLGEVLWSLDQKDRAQAIWKEGLLINAENETLLETLKRLRVKF